MIKNGLHYYQNKRILLLQGPMGPFFRRLAYDLSKAGADVYKINFNGGDWLFYPTQATNFRGSPEEWPEFLNNVITSESIDVIMLFGDCRPIHKDVKRISAQHGIDVEVFEEGYVRPDYITFEQHGVNGFSSLPRIPQAYLGEPPQVPDPKKAGKNAFWFLVLWTIIYVLASVLLKPLFNNYRHHKPLTLFEAKPWLQSIWRKWYYTVKEHGIEKTLTETHHKNYYLVPLQVNNDFQIQVHSTFDSVAEFIKNTVVSFAHHAHPETLLVFKHHPLDRGHFDYTKLIRQLAKEHNLADRIIYIHDQHLPSLIKHAAGVVVVNSTTGLSALHHNTPLKVCGNALYNMPGLTFQPPLDSFWSAAGQFNIDRKLYQHFRQHLIARTQVNGSFYKRVVQTRGTGVLWETRTRPEYRPALQTSSASSVPNFSIHAVPVLEETA